MKRKDRHTTEEFQRQFLARIEGVNLTDRELADYLDVGMCAVKRWKEGRNSPTPSLQDLLLKERL